MSVRREAKNKSASAIPQPQSVIEPMDRRPASFSNHAPSAPSTAATATIGLSHSTTAGIIRRLASTPRPPQFCNALLLPVNRNVVTAAAKNRRYGTHRLLQAVALGQRKPKRPSLETRLTPTAAPKAAKTNDG